MRITRIIGLSDTPPNNQSGVYAEFKEQLVRDKEGWYATGLPWRGDHPVLPNNEERSLRRLRSLNRRLERQNLTSEYAKIIEYQKKEGVVERTGEPRVGGREFYIPQKPVVRATALREPLMALHRLTIVCMQVRPAKQTLEHTG